MYKGGHPWYVNSEFMFNWTPTWDRVINIRKEEIMSCSCRQMRWALMKRVYCLLWCLSDGQTCSGHSPSFPLSYRNGCSEKDTPILGPRLIVSRGIKTGFILVKHHLMLLKFERCWRAWTPSSFQLIRDLLLQAHISFTQKVPRKLQRCLCTVITSACTNRTCTLLKDQQVME